MIRTTRQPLVSIRVPTSRRRRRTRSAAFACAIVLVVLASGGAVGRDVVVRGRDVGTAMVLQNVTLTDLGANTHGICNGSFTHVMKNSAGASNALNFLDKAAACGLKVILFFPETANHSTGVVYPSRVAYWAGLVKNHPALWGYLTVKEPSWAGISAAEIRSLYSAFKAADPNHPVMALFGDIPHFGETANPYTAGMADVVMVDWYPVETGNGGSATTGTTYISTGPTWFTKVRNVVASRTPGRPIWLMAQTHKYLAPATHKKQRPSETLLRRQVREGLGYLGARGIAYHTWSNTSYNSDQLRDPTMVGWMKRISNEIRTGTFN